MILRALVVGGLVGLLVIDWTVSSSVAQQPKWIWTDEPIDRSSYVVFQQTFEFDEAIKSVELTVLGDCLDCFVFVNGNLVAELPLGSSPQSAVVTDLVSTETNLIELVTDPGNGPKAVMAILDVELASGEWAHLSTDEVWKSCQISKADFARRVLDRMNDSDEAQSLSAIDQAIDLSPSVDLGSVAESLLVRPREISIGPLDNYEQWRQASDAEEGTHPATFDLLEGFEIRLLRSATDEEDSWVAMAQDSQGRWTIAKEKHGLLRMTLSDDASQIENVELINDHLAECRGLLYVGDVLFAMANNDKALYRLRDTTGDDQFDEVSELYRFEGDVGHGRNQLILGHDNDLYAIFGDAVFEPTDIESLPTSIQDPLHEETTRNGFLAKADLDGENWEVITRGLRNPYGVAVNDAGDFFTYDADAEYDMGSPWYRPTRMLHLLPGGDYGWRRVTQQWPPYFPDRADIPQSTLDIGKGSPTAVVFGAGEQFPHPYDQSLYILDWAYGRILAVFLEPSGSSYVATSSTFLRGQPLNVTDIEFGLDGSMYFVTGGRGTQSALYQVSYVGTSIERPEWTDQQTHRREFATTQHEVRELLQQALIRPDALNLDQVWERLADRDPWLRHTARTALENQPFDSWRDRLSKEDAPRRKLAALTALIRSDSANSDSLLTTYLASIDPLELEPRLLSEYLFLVRRMCIKAAATSHEELAPFIERLESAYPHFSRQVNRELSLALSEQSVSDSFVKTSLDLMSQSRSQEEKLHYLFVLRSVPNGWTDELRGQYFESLQQADLFVRGAGMPTFLQQIRTEALAALPIDQREKYEAMLESNNDDQWTESFANSNRSFVAKWELDDFESLTTALAERRDLERGEQVFFEARCSLCHRLNNRGGVYGPDLESVARRFAPIDILRSILRPSDVVSSAYQSESFLLNDGRVLSGTIKAGDYRSETIQLIPDLMKPAEWVEFSKHEIDSHETSTLSPMPEGLIDMFSREEILDLLAFLVENSR